MSTGRSGRPVQQVDKGTERDLDRIRQKVARTEAALEVLWSERDSAISLAYMSGVNKNRIAALVGVTVKTVNTSLIRSGAIDE